MSHLAVAITIIVLACITPITGVLAIGIGARLSKRSSNIECGGIAFAVGMLFGWIPTILYGWHGLCGFALTVPSFFLVRWMKAILVRHALKEGAPQCNAPSHGQPIFAPLFVFSVISFYIAGHSAIAALNRLGESGALALALAGTIAVPVSWICAALGLRLFTKVTVLASLQFIQKNCPQVCARLLS